MQVVPAQLGDVPAWLQLAAEVEPLFGPMVNEPHFGQAVHGSIEGGAAFCIREADGPTGACLLGAMMFARKSLGQYGIGWLAVTARARRQGIASQLVRHAVSLAELPAVIRVKTFTQDKPDGLPARRFYERHGFVAGELVSGPHGQTVQVFRLQVAAPCA